MNQQFFDERNKITFYTALFIGIVLFLFVVQMGLGAPNFVVQRTIIPEATDTYQVGSSTNPVRRWLNGYFKNASTSVFSVHDTFYIGGTATSTIYGTATSTFLSGIELDALYAIRGLSIGGTATSTILGSATSTFGRGIETARGVNIGLTSCDSLDTNADGAVICGSDAGGSLIPNLIYRTLSTTKYYTASTSATDNLAFHFNNGFVSSASSTIAGQLNLLDRIDYQLSSTSTIPNLTSAFTYATSTTNTSLLTLSTKSSRYGRIGIGTSSPSALFAINALNSSNQADNLFYIGSSTANVFLVDNHGNIGVGTSTRSTSKARFSITGFGIGTNRILALADANNSEVFTIQENGNVGIGTAVPGTNLEILSATTQGDRLRITNTNALSGGQGGNFMNFYAGATRIGSIGFGGEDANDANFDISQIINGVFTEPVFRIQRGNVGIGTTTPNDNATSSTAGVVYASGAFRNQMCYLTDAATTFVDGNCGNRFRVQMAGNRIIEFHHFYEGQTGIITLQQDATGSRIPTKWVAVSLAGTRRGVVWRANATTVLSTAANRIDKIGFEMGTDTMHMIASSTNFIPIDY